MREIKFRVWNGLAMEYDVMTGKFGTFYVNPGAKGDGIDESDSASLTTLNTKYSDEAPLMQYTGLSDENAIEAYEGDVVENEVARWLIVFNKGCFAVRHLGAFHMDLSYHPEKRIESETCLALRGLRGWKIVGNAYENPELL